MKFPVRYRFDPEAVRFPCDYFSSYLNMFFFLLHICVCGYRYTHAIDTYTLVMKTPRFWACVLEWSCLFHFNSELPYFCNLKSTFWKIEAWGGYEERVILWRQHNLKVISLLSPPFFCWMRFRKQPRETRRSKPHL